MGAIRNRRGLLASSAICGAALALLVVGAARAQPRGYDIPAESLSQALRDYGRQSGLQIIFTEDLVRGRSAPGVRGSLEPAEALKILLGGTGLHAESTPSGVVMIVRDPGPQSAAAPAAAEPAQVSELTVTGTRLAAPTAIPARSYGREEIRNSGVSDINDFLNRLPDVTFAPGGDNIRSFMGANTPQIHGLPQGTTLTLLNGRRLEAGVLGFFDVNAIPAAAVTKVDVIPVGLSAIYGSDALAGAVNLVTRDRFDGVDLSVRYGHARGTDDTTVELTVGRSGERFSGLATVSFNDKSELRGAERAATSRTDWPPQVAFLGLTAACSPATVYSLDGGDIPGIGAPLALAPPTASGQTPSAAQFQPGVEGRCNPNRDLSIIPNEKRLSVYASGSYRLTDAAELFAELVYTNDRAHFGQSPAVLGLNGLTTIGPDNPFNPFGARLGIAFADQTEEFFADKSDWFVRPLVGVRGEAFGWRYELTAAWQGYSLNTNFAVPNFAAEQAALDSADPTQALDPFSTGATGSQATIGGLRAAAMQVPTTRRDTYEIVQGFIRRDLPPLWGRTVEIVLGAEAAHESQSQETPDIAAATLKRSDYAAYGEARVPLLVGSKGLPEPLVLNLAARVDHADRFAAKWTGQAGLQWRPRSDLLFTASYATSYVAPTLQQTLAPPFIFEGGGSDPLRNNESFIGPETEGANPNLKPETGTSLSLGAVYQGTAVPLRVGVTYFETKVRNFIGLPDLTAVLEHPEVFGALVTRAPPTPADVAAGLPGRILSVEDVFFNFGRIDVNGFDVDASYVVETRVGTFTPSLSATVTTKWTSLVTPGLPPVNGLGHATFFGVGWSPRIKGNLGLAWERDRLSAQLLARYVGRYTDYPDFDPQNRLVLGDFWTFDATGQVRLGRRDAGDRQPVLRAGVINLLDTPPQFSESNGFDGKIADVRGRFFYVQIEKRW